MKRIILSLVFGVSTYLVFGQTQAEMNEQAHAIYLKADKELNAVYQQILKEYADDKDFIESLKSSQRLWVTFRDAEMKMKYPHPREYYGSVFPMCWNNYMAELTQERTKKLRIWLAGIEEGDVCGGSLKLKD